MRCLIENEVGYHATHMGFPSIRGCHAIVLVTASGLFGLHNYGGDNPDQWTDRATAFAGWVTAHPRWQGGAAALYGACFVTTVAGSARGYGTSNPALNWKSELKKFADMLNFPGKIFGLDLARTACLPPCYVDVLNVGNTRAVLSAKTWNKNDGTQGPNTHPQDHQLMRRPPNGLGYTIQATAPQITRKVTSAGLTTVLPIELRA